jgi:hypothetical protein
MQEGITPMRDSLAEQTHKDQTLQEQIAEIADPLGHIQIQKQEVTMKRIFHTVFRWCEEKQKLSLRVS